MPAGDPILIIPCESQNREFDAKLLLACFAAERGFSVIVGCKKEIHLRAGSLPRSIFLSKSLTNRNLRLYDALGQLGHQVVCGDEEALIYFSAESYLNTKVGEEAFRRAKLLLAWGPENERVWKSYDHYHGVDIQVTGNSRVDLLRPELRSYFDEEADKIIQRFGTFILINTNYSRMNHYYPRLSHQRRILEEGAAGTQGPSEFTRGFAAHKKVLFESFLEMVPHVARAFPDTNVVVRPHPSENHQAWVDASGGASNVHVLHEGNAIPWLRAAQVTVHNGCTTAVESFLMGSPTIAYQPIQSEDFDLALANDLSISAENLETLTQRIREGLDGELAADPQRQEKQKELIAQHVASLEGPFASERIVEALEAFALKSPPSKPSAPVAWKARTRLGIRAVRKKWAARRPENRNSAEYVRHMFPGVTLPEAQQRIQTYGRILNRFEKVRARQIFENVFEVSA